jgi:hypothetical protein
MKEVSTIKDKVYLQQKTPVKTSINEIIFNDYLEKYIQAIPREKFSEIFPNIIL